MPSATSRYSYLSADTTEQGHWSREVSTLLRGLAEVERETAQFADAVIQPPRALLQQQSDLRVVDSVRDPVELEADAEERLDGVLVQLRGDPLPLSEQSPAVVVHVRLVQDCRRWFSW